MGQSMRVYPTEYRSDPRLRLCSLEARGFWVECVCVMHQLPLGDRLSNTGKPLEVRHLAQLVGCSEDEVRSSVAALLETGALARGDDGALFSPIIEDWRALTGRLPQAEWDVVRAKVFERDDFTCRYCGDKSSALDCDHIIPIARGGSNDIKNLTTACFRCNRSKGSKLLSEWGGRNARA